MTKLYESKGMNAFVYMGEELARKLDPDGEDFIEIPSGKLLDISSLVNDEYVDFFTNPDSEFAAIFAGDGTNRHKYPMIMESFKSAVSRAYTAVSPLCSRKEEKPIWARMREKYFDGRDYVYPDEMIEHLNDFSVDELVAFLHYCVLYKERFYDGVYGVYAKDGFIGQILLRLKEFPLEIQPVSEEEE